MAAKEDQDYLLGQHGREVERLQKQHRWIQSCLKGKIVFAPVELGKSGLRVLDVGCADGRPCSLRSPTVLFLRK
jgi:2-polyprenyl-3-methyl-5-hydroxy-6-metoxy-1,4-benzoquinol methylase